MHTVRAHGQHWTLNIRWHRGVPLPAYAVKHCTLRVLGAPDTEASTHLLAGEVYPLSEAPTKWLGDGLDGSREIVEGVERGTYVHFLDGVLRVQPGHLPLAFVASTGPAIVRHGVLGALIHSALLARGIIIAHAAALIVQDAAWLVFGCSGAGKSTLAAAWIHAGRRALTDDAAVVLPPEDGRKCWRTEPWRDDVALKPDVAARFLSRPLSGPDHSRGSAELAGGDKVWLRRVERPGAFQDDARVSRLLFLGSRTGSARVEPMPQSEALADLLVSHSMLARDDDVGTRARLSIVKLVSQIPAARLRVGDDLLAAPADEVSRIEALVANLPRIAEGV